MTKRNTKDLILNVALKFFSERGYDGVGLREIAKEIGINESAIYKHFKSKKEIFETIISKMSDDYKNKSTAFNLPDIIASTISGGIVQENMIKMCVLMFQIYLKNEYGSQLRRMLTFEQVKNTEVGKTFQKELIDGGLSYITTAFAELIKDGYYADFDPHIMALQFFSPFYLLLVKYDHHPDCYNTAMDFLASHIKQFDTIHRIERGKT